MEIVFIAGFEFVAQKIVPPVHFPRSTLQIVPSVVGLRSVAYVCATGLFCIRI